MKIILDDSFTIRNIIPDIEELCTIAQIGYTGPLPVGILAIKHKYVRSLSRQVSINRQTGLNITVYTPEVYGRTGKNKRLICWPIPMRSTAQHGSYSWRMYAIDIEKKQFVNIGPKNGTVFEFSETLEWRTPNDNPYKEMMLRVDNDGDMIIDGILRRVSTYRDYPEQGYRLWLRGNNNEYSDSIDDIINGTMYIGLLLLDQIYARCEMKSTVLWKHDNDLDFTIDLTKDEFPLSDENLMYWVMAQ
jgi:hypothetical protein